MSQGYASMLSRRRFIEIAAAAGVAGVISPGQSKASARIVRWTGVSMGAGTSITLAHDNEAEAARIIAAARVEIDRLEAIFSLYRADSALSRLNRDGRFDLPPFELVSLLSLADGINDATSGAFDPTVQPLWQAYARHFGQADADPGGPGPRTIAAARALTGWRFVAFGNAGIRFSKPGMALTLNGIAQGFVTDRIADLLRAEGLQDVLVNVGEIQALGRHPDGHPWRAGLAERGDAAPEERIDIEETALATSAPLGTVLDPAGRMAHIIDPATGGPASGRWRRVSVLGPSAAIADGLSTAFSLMPADAVWASLRHYPGYRVIAVGADQARLDLVG
jgi:FAD:protein FMN transferase